MKYQKCFSSLLFCEQLINVIGAEEGSCVRLTGQQDLKCFSFVGNYQGELPEVKSTCA